MPMSRNDFDGTLVPSLLTEVEQKCLRSFSSDIQDKFYDLYAKGIFKDEHVYYCIRHAQRLVNNCTGESLQVAHRVFLLGLKTMELIHKESLLIIKERPLDEVLYLSTLTILGWIKYTHAKGYSFDGDDAQWVLRSAAVLSYLNRFHSIVPWDQWGSFYSTKEDSYTDQWGHKFKCLYMESSALQDILFDSPELHSHIERFVDERNLSNSEPDVYFVKKHVLDMAATPALSDGCL